MIKAHAYPLMIVLIFGLMESLILAYDYFTIIMLALFFTVTSDILIFNLSESRAVAGLQISRSVRHEKLAKGGTTTVTVTLRNRSMASVHLDYEDVLSETLTSENNRGRVSIKAGGTAEFEYTISTPFCGKQQIGPLRASLNDPFHFCSRTLELETLSAIPVETNLPGIADSRREMSRRMKNPAGTRQIVRGGQGYQFLKIRQYTEGDDLRGIVWNRYGTLPGNDIFVKEMQEERTREIVFLIDYSSGTTFGNMRRRMYDDVISAVLRSAQEMIKFGDRVGFLFYSSVHCRYIPARSAMTAGEAARSFVSDSFPAGVFQLTSGIREARKRIGKSTAVIVVTPMLDAQKFEPQMAYLLTGGSVTAVLLMAGSYAEKADDDLKSLLLKCAAGSKQEEIRRMGRFLSHSGMRTVLSNADELQLKMMEAWAHGRMLNAGS